MIKAEHLVEIVIIISFILFVGYIIYDYSTNTPKCKLNGYEWYNNVGYSIESGYILCCRNEFVNHIKEVRCDAIKE